MTTPAKTRGPALALSPLAVARLLEKHYPEEGASTRLVEATGCTRSDLIRRARELGLFAPQQHGRPAERGRPRPTCKPDCRGEQLGALDVQARGEPRCAKEQARRSRCRQLAMEVVSLRDARGGGAWLNDLERAGWTWEALQLLLAEGAGWLELRGGVVRVTEAGAWELLRVKPEGG